MNFRKLLLLFPLTVFLSGIVYSQTKHVNYNVTFNSGNQNMWGPSWNAYSINQTINLFNVPWNQSFDSGNGGIFSIAGMDFGAAMSGAFSGVIGSNFSLNGFTTGEVAVNYPIKVDLEMPDDQTYDQGDSVTINSSYSVTNGSSLESYYPSLGEAKLDIYFRIAAELSAKICLFGCATFPIIPQFDTGVQTINVFTANSSGVDLFSYGGLPPLYSFPGLPLETSDIPNDPLGNYGISGSLTVPYVITDDQLNGQELHACGDSVYLNLNLDVFDLISGLEIPYLSALTTAIHGSQTIGVAGFGVDVWWSLFDANFDMNIDNKQCFDFKPKVYNKFEFPVAVGYTIYNPSNQVVEQGESSIINMEVGNQLRYKFPCYFEDLHITPTYSIDGQFTNHTYDSVSFDFNMSAFSFGIEVPAVEITPAIYVPEVCVRIPYPCGFIHICHKRICTPSFTIPAVGFDGITLSFGPLWEYQIPLGSFTYDWYKNTWALEGFSEYTEAPFLMKANKLSVTHTQTDILCNGATTGSVQLANHALSPASPYSYQWTNGAVTQNLTDVPAGSYQVQVEDAHGCKLFTGVVLEQPVSELELTYTKVDKSCNSGSNDGSIHVTPQGGTAPYSYLWNTGATTANLSNLNNGTYSVTVTDNHGCSQSLSISIDQPTALQQVGLTNNVLCKNGMTGQISVATNGGVAPYSYSWSSGQTSATITGLAAGNYTLTVTDAKGCENSSTYSITEPSQSLQLNATVTDVLCKGDKTGAISISTSGGTAGYSYQWSDQTGSILPTTSQNISGIYAGTYTVMATDNNGCTQQLTEIVAEPSDALSSNPTVQNINCFGEATGQIDPGISGGTPSYNYSWSDGSTTSILTNVSAGMYDLTVTDANGCTASYHYELTQPLEAISIEFTHSDVLCYGDATGAINATVDGGTAPYAYTWSNGSTSDNISGIPAGNYTLTVTDELGCVLTNSSQVSQPSAPLTGVSIPTDINCYGDNTGVVSLSISGGTAPYNYQWSNSGNVILSQTSATILNLPADSYTALVTDQNGCTFTNTSIVQQPAAPITYSSSITNVNCYGMNQGGVDLIVQGGTAPYTYLWSNGEVTEDISNVVSGTYTFTITDNNNCVKTGSFTITQPSEALTSTLIPTAVLCKGGSDGKIEAQVEGGTAPYTYSWSNGSTANGLKNIPAGIYSLTVTDNNGCSAYTGAVVEEPADSLLVTTTVTDVTCYGYSDASVDISISGGTAPYSYNWGNQGQILMNNFSEHLGNLKEGKYFIRVTDRYGCINEQFVDVNQPDPIHIQAVISDNLCFGDSTGMIAISTTGGTPSYTYQWDNGQSTANATQLVAGNHQLRITDANACVFDTTMFVKQPDKLGALNSIQQLTCMDENDGEIYVSGYGGIKPYSYVWNMGDSSNHIYNLGAGSYEVTVSDFNGCIVAYTYIISESNVHCVFVPNTFTPNGDNYNDTWIIDDIDLYPNASVKVFNKWGNLIFDSKGTYKPWDGTFNGKKLPSAVYYYIINLNNNHSEKYTGTITIIR